MLSSMNSDPIQDVLRDVVKRGFTITIGPHKDAPCGIFAAKDGVTWGRCCEIDAKQIGLVLEKLPALWNYEVTPG